MQRIITILLFVSLVLSACTHPIQVTPLPVITTSATTPTSLATPVILSAASPTETSTPIHTPAIIPTRDPVRSTPPTLMLHRPNLQFDSLAFLKDFVEILKQNNMQVVTYRDIYENRDITATERGKLFIITIDDIYLAYPIDKRVIEMFDLLKEAGYPAVLGVVTETDYPYPETVKRLQELSGLGWEIASHTDNHANIGDLEKASEKLVTREVAPSLDKIEKAIGIRPITLILPGGQMVNDIRIFSALNIYWAVGINGGVQYDSRKTTIYVGREGPDKNAEYTYKIMKLRFGF